MGRKRGASGPKEKKRKKVPWKLIERKHAGKVVEPYRILEEVQTAHHSHLKDATILLAWHEGWKHDADGHRKLGMAKKCSDLDRERMPGDFVVVLNQNAWEFMDDTQKRALIDHELCHCQVAADTNGEPKIDDRGRVCYRMRRHDIEEFQEVVARHGCYKADLGRFVEAAMKKRTEPLFNQPKDDKPAQKTNGIHRAKDIGWAAFGEGKKKDSNPYAMGSPDWDDWRDGWHGAQEAAKAKGKDEKPATIPMAKAGA